LPFEITTIVDVQLQRLEKRLAAQQLHLELDESAKKLLTKEGDAHPAFVDVRCE
jgi:ATP-dependent Clp protease ATP-binding subunit ClpA